MSNLNSISATEIAKRIKDRDISVVDVTIHFIEKQRRLNPKLNGLVEDRWDLALEEAEQKDKELETLKDPPPLFGLPITVKEMIAVQGCRNTLGSIHRKSIKMKQSATVVDRVQKAGAIVLGTSNVPELGFWFECENPVYGWTKNPYDLKRTSGGSTGGEGALIGSGASLFGLGSDVGGSIRTPAGFCGIYGHKPSNRIIPMTGHYPVTLEAAKELKDPYYPLTVLGPMTRSAKDLRLLMQIMIGPDGLDQEVRSDFELKPEVNDWTDSTVWILPRPVMTAVSANTDETAEAVEISGQYFESLGATVKKMRPDVFREAFSFWSVSLAQIQADSTFEDNLFAKKQMSVLQELFRSLTSKPNYTIPALGTVLLERFQRGYGRQLEEGQTNTLRRLQQLKGKLNHLLGEKNILIMPGHPRPAPLHRGTYLRPFDFAYTGVLNALEMPATSVPINLSKQGLPIGVQVVAGADQDHLCLSAAETLESAFGGWKPPQ